MKYSVLQTNFVFEKVVTSIIFIFSSIILDNDNLN